jgi:catechol 2,3-dioxygenase-like lactoylglutathione lyase family enzyme
MSGLWRAAVTAPLVPELDVADLDRSLSFYVEVLGFRVRHDRPEEAFAYLQRDGAELMLQAAQGPGRRFRTAPLQPPFGRGVNLQIRVADAAALLGRLAEAGYRPLIPLETRWYRAGRVELGNRQFVVADPDGYLLRFFEDLGDRPLQGDAT